MSRTAKLALIGFVFRRPKPPKITKKAYKSLLLQN